MKQHIEKPVLTLTKQQLVKHEALHREIPRGLWKVTLLCRVPREVGVCIPVLGNKKWRTAVLCSKGDGEWMSDRAETSDFHPCAVAAGLRSHIQHC